MCCIVPNITLSLFYETGKQIVDNRKWGIQIRHPIFYFPFSTNIFYMNIENTQSQMRKGILEFCILSIIRRGEAYPSDIVEEMRAANLQIFEGTLYPLLTRLKNAEMLTYRWVESNSGPPRKYYRLTASGKNTFVAQKTEWVAFARAVDAILGGSE